MKDIIFLYGPPASGKSTIGRKLAQALNLPFIDLDNEIEKSTQTTIPEIFSSIGEIRFREIEEEILQGVIKQNDGVIALGGGTLTNSMNLNRVQGTGPIICLLATHETLISRLDLEESTHRPLLSSNPEENLLDLLALRSNHYYSFPLGISVDGKSPEKITRETQLLLGRYSLFSSNQWYDIRVISGGLDRVNNRLYSSSSHPSQIAVVTDDHVGPIYSERVIQSLKKDGHRVNLIQIPSGENHKNLQTVEYLWDQFIGAHLDRQSLVLALGGGVVSDITGFASATYLRGIDWAVIPTSLLAMVDASFGGKTGIDLPQAKNLIGAFHSPKWVLVDPNLITTLPEVELRNGFAEIVKHGVIGDPTLFLDCGRGMPGDSKDWVNLINKAIAVKIAIVQRDPFEQGMRAALNFGHTIGHGLEKLSNFKLRHGEAVSIGMVVETQIAERVGLARPGLREEIENVLDRIGLPIRIPMELADHFDKLVDLIQFDKKRTGDSVRFALPAEIGDVRTGIAIENIKEYL